MTADSREGDAGAVIADVTARLRARGERMTRPRRVVLTALAGHHGHLSAEAVVAVVAQLDPSVHRDSVHRTLEALSHLGAIQHVHLGHGSTAYHLVDGHRHGHVQCRVCGEVIDLDPHLLDGAARVLVEEHGFTLDVGHVALSGVCRSCGDAAAGRGH
ncbi:MAG: Fur family transcriptional regulator [Dermatophilaceae bacterium]